MDNGIGALHPWLDSSTGFALNDIPPTQPRPSDHGTMADIRFDPFTDIWVAIARKRLDRPVELVPVQEVQQQILCPFCRGNEDETPPATLMLDTSSQPIDNTRSTKWSARIVPNKFPSLDSDASESAIPPFCSVQENGIQEIVIPTPRHIQSMSQLTVEELTIALLATRQRMSELAELSSVRHIQFFMNVGAAAGATLAHVHMQLIGSPIVSPALDRRLAANRRYRENHGVSLIEGIRKSEMEARTRIVDHSQELCCLCPFASRFGFQSWIVPARGTPYFAQAPDSLLEALARHLITATVRLERVLDRPAYNLILHQAPIGSENDAWPWFFELFPRFAVPAGLEFGTDIWVNPVPPEFAARRLRSATD